MKKLAILSFSLALMLPIFGSNNYPQKENSYRFMSYNIHHGRGMDNVVNIERIGKLILDVDPEVVGLQEVDSVVNRSGNRDIMNLLAEQTGMYAVFGPSIILDNGKYGNGVLSKDKPVDVKILPLPGVREARTALIVELPRYVVVNTHLSLINKERVESVKLITEAVRHYQKPVILIGDLNAKPDEDPLLYLKKEWQIINDIKLGTYPSVKPHSTIDYILGYGTNGQTYTKLEYRVIDEEIASDHRPIFGDIRFKTPASEVMRTIPYLQSPGNDEMTIMWLTNVPARSWVEYGTDPDNLKRARTFIEGEMVANNRINKIRLTDLEPGTRYWYRAVSQEITRYSSYKKEFGDTVRSELRSFTTWSDKMRDFRIIVYNDIHKNMEMFHKLHSLVDHKPYDLVIFNGDCFDDPEEESDIVNRLLNYTKGIGSDRVPSFFIRGNHETRGAYSQHLWDYLGKMGGHSYGSFSLGDTRFVFLDCGEDKPDDHWVYYDMNDFGQHRLNQVEFLKGELRSNPFKKAKRRVLIHHIPLFGENLDKYTPCSDLWIPVLEKAPFDLSLNGHTHSFEYIPKGKYSNNFPVVIGGGNNLKTATVMVLEKRDKSLTLEVLNSSGERLAFLDL